MGLLNGMFGTQRAPEKEAIKFQGDPSSGVLTPDGKMLDLFGDKRKDGQQLIIVKKQPDGSPKAYDNATDKEITDAAVLAKLNKMWKPDSPERSMFYHKAE